MSRNPSSISGVDSAIAQLQGNLDKLVEQSDSAGLAANKRRPVEKQIRKIITQLSGLLDRLDPIRQPTAIFDPSNPKIIGRFVSLALVAQSRHSLGDIGQFYGSGVYAIYYTGPYHAYLPISKSETPIYVGQAAPAIPSARTPMEQGAKLCKRLAEHAKNIAKANTTLSLDDFEFRSLVVQSGWESAAEDYLIHLFRPIWNSETDILYGLGKHGDAATTRANKRSPWDTLHPGRKWAAATTEDGRSASRISSDLMSHFASHRAFPDIEAVLTSFIEELRQV